MNDKERQLYEDIREIPIIDTHEHLPAGENKRSPDNDVLQEYLIHYMNSDLQSSGMPIAVTHRIMFEKMSIVDKWKLVEPWWDNCRLTGYGRALDISAKEIYGIEKISGETIEELNRRYRESREDGGHYRKVLKDCSNIRLSIVDSDPDCDREFFRSTVNLDRFVSPGTKVDLLFIEGDTGVKIHNLDDWMEACRLSLEKALDKGAVVLKSTLAYKRSIRYDKVTRHAAEEEFRTFFDKLYYPGWENPPLNTGKALQDYMMHFLLGLAENKGLPVQIHTGIQEGNGNILDNSNPLHLNNLFIEYPGINFSIFHMGYPFHQVVPALVKNFPNVAVDMCWAHIISPSASREALYQWLDTIPVNKILGFGGDYGFIDGICGHQVIARENIAIVLNRLIEEGRIDRDMAMIIARKLLHDNAVKFLKLEEHL